MQRVVIVDHQLGVLPVISPKDGDITSKHEDGAFFAVNGDHAQIIVVGPMHFTPGQYLEALNELLEERFEHHYNAFMTVPHILELQNTVLSRGYIDLRFRKP